MRKMDLTQIKFIWPKIKLDFIKIKITNLCSVKAHVRRVKRQTTELGTVLANHMLDKEVESGIYDRLSKFNIKK